MNVFAVEMRDEMDETDSVLSAEKKWTEKEVERRQLLFDFTHRGALDVTVG